MSEEERYTDAGGDEPMGAAQEPIETPAEEPVAAGAKMPTPGTAPAPAYVTTTRPAASSSEDDRLMAALAWLSALILQVPLVSLVLLIAEPNRNRPFQRYHAVTSLVFWVAAIAYELLAVVVYLVLGVLTVGIGLVCLWPIFLVPHIFALYYTYTAFIGQQPEIPVISPLVRQQGWL
ncbi:MAG TPA: hypothetical protein VGA61_11025 [Anaerolineae bacterium]